MSEPIHTRGRYREGAIELAKPVPGLDGMELEVAISFPEAGSAPAHAQMAARYPGPLVELGHDLREIGQGEESSLVRHIREFRERLLEATGFNLPSVRIALHEDLAPNAYAFRVRAIRVGQGRLRLDRLLVVVADPKDRQRLIDFRTDIGPDPIFGLPSCWICPSLESRAHNKGLTVATPAAVLAGHLEETLLRHLPECLEREAVHGIIAAAREVSPQLVASLVPGRISVSRLHGLLRTMLALKHSIAPIQVIFEAIDAHGGDDDEQLARSVASRLPAFGKI